MQNIHTYFISAPTVEDLSDLRNKVYAFIASIRMKIVFESSFSMQLKEQLYLEERIAKLRPDVLLQPLRLLRLICGLICLSLVLHL